MPHWKSRSLEFDFGHAVQRDDHKKQPPDKDTLVQSPGALRPIGHAVDHTKQPPDKDSLVQSPQVLRSIGHAVQRDDHTKQPPDNDTPVWNPRAQGSIFLDSHINLIPCTSDMADACSSLPTTACEDYLPEEQGVCIEQSSESNNYSLTPAPKLLHVHLAGCIFTPEFPAVKTQPASLTRSSQGDLDIKVQLPPGQQLVTGKIFMGLADPLRKRRKSYCMLQHAPTTTRKPRVPQMTVHFSPSSHGL